MRSRIKHQLGGLGLVALAALPLLGCGLSDWATRLTRPKPTPTANIVVVVEQVATAAPPANEPTAAPDVGDVPTVTPTAVATAPPVEAVTPATQSSAPLPVASLQDSLKLLDSYHAEYQFKVEGPTGFVTGSVLIEETQAPRAIHLVMRSESSLPGAENGLENLEIYIMSNSDGRATMYMQNPQDQSWLAVAVNDINAAYDILPISLAALDTLPPQSRLVGQENVNNVPTNHFTYTQNDFPPASPALNEAQGDIWIGVDKNIVMRLIQRIKGGNTPVLKDTSNQITAYEMNFELKKFNDTTIAITPPGQNTTGADGIAP